MDRDWLFTLIPLGLGSIFLAIGVHGIRRARHLRRTGAKAYGHIVRHDTSSGDHGTLYHPVAAWQTPDGRWHEHSARIGRSWKGQFKVGVQVLVHYDAADPQRAAIEGYDGAGVDWVFATIGAGVAGGTLIFSAVVLLSR